ncbi:MAG TPA: MFS transporter [Mucilaginibacter sp.]|nr:MFS transporter [Mucilaginibacter sp.]
MNEKPGNYRWTICALIFMATTINYLDRAVISLLRPYISKDLHWNDADYANIEIAFKVAYSVGLLLAGRLVDRLGTKMGYFFSTFLWSASAALHALVNSTLGFITVRTALGLSEAGNFPSAIKTVAEWFPKKERAFATGIFNSGANIGAVLAPGIIYINMACGWRWAFVITGAIGFLWLILWLWFYEIPTRQKRLKKPELEYIHSDADEKDHTDKLDEKISWGKLLSYKQTWAFSIGKFLTDPIWWFYLFWLPDFLTSQYGIKDTALVLPVSMVYIISTFGSIYGGYLPKSLIDKGWLVFRARKTSMLIYAFAVVPIVFAQVLGSINMWLAVAIIGIAASAHQAWSANIFTTVSDMFPKKTVGSVTGIGGMFGSVGGVFLSLFVQKNMFVYYRSIHHIEIAYYIMFFVCGSAYLLAWCIMHFLVPKMKPVDL